MRSTGVVQGLKSLAAKINSQLPLSARESNRLLTALTSSFRKHLDEAHPDTVRPTVDGGDIRKTSASGVAVSTNQGIHSSAVYADRHLASVLTSPLFVKGGERLDFVSAKTELNKNPAKDPIQLFEEYHDKDAATISIAELCLEHFFESLKKTPTSQRKTVLQEHQAGRRILLWFLQNKIHDPASYVDHLAFLDLLVHALVVEGREQNVWNWLKLDIAIPISAEELRRHITIKKMSLRYRWKGRLLGALIKSKLGFVDGISRPVPLGNLHLALDAFFLAVELQQGALPQEAHLHWLPLGSASTQLVKEVTWRVSSRRDLDPGRFDRFRDALPIWEAHAGEIHQAMKAGLLDVCHPRRPSAKMALLFWQSVLSDQPSVSAQTFIPRFHAGQHSAEVQQWFKFLCRTVFVLRNENLTEEASWLKEEAATVFPQLAQYVENDIKEWEQGAGEDQSTATSKAGHESARIPYPTFA